MTEDDDICGYEETTTGEPCKWSPGESCPFHDPDRESIDNGRPTKLSYERQEGIATTIEDGTPLVAACRNNDITWKTHKNWMDRGEAHYEDGTESPYRDYFLRLGRALGFDQTKKTELLWKTAKDSGNTGVMLTILKQRYPDTWGDAEIGEADGEQIVINVPESTRKREH